MKISVCIPMYNENAVIADTAHALSAYMEANFKDYEILFCSDGSTDGCDETVRCLGLPNTRVISYTPNHGKGRAVRCAMREATGDIRMFTDADLAYGTEVIGRIAKMFEEHPDAALIIGSRNLSADGYAGYSAMRKFASKLYLKILCLVGGFRLSDSQCGCKAFSRPAVERLLPWCEVDGFAFDFELLLLALKEKMPIYEMPVRVIRHGGSKVHVFRDSIRMLRDLSRMKKRIRKTDYTKEGVS